MTMSSRVPDQREYSHDRLGDRFERALSQYDTRRRVETLVDEFLTDEMVRGKHALDVGCGLGYFSEALAKRGAIVTACDLGPNLVEATRKRVGCEAVVADALRLVDQFGRDRFDLVLSSECIEHTPDPQACLRQMAGVLKPGGYLSLSTPNLLWQPVVRLASRLELRAFDGHENFSTWGSLARPLGDGGVKIIRRKGLHLFPFQFGLHELSRYFDEHLQVVSRLMINLCILGRKDPE
ncbi:class I SAM-dependent methyltransferase [Sorangium sp. So ce128]|uniref:class I SAM-dependent methyltransferase n=1 Tax=Sorangium sp. So ce128 TaxID=3133281 RepID=UPI003F6339D0